MLLARLEMFYSYSLVAATPSYSTMSVLFLVVLSLQCGLSTSADYCQSRIQDCQSNESDSFADFQEIFVQYQRECDEKEYFQIKSVEKENRIYQLEITVKQAIEGLLLQMCGDDEAYFLYSTNVNAPSTCNYENDTYIVTKSMKEQELKYIGSPITTVIRYIILDHQRCSYQGLVKYHQRQLVDQSYDRAESDEHSILRKRRQVTTGLQYLLVTSRNIIHQVSLDGTRSHAVVSNLVNSIALDYDYRRNKIYWTDVNSNTLMQSNLDGSGMITLLSKGLDVPDGLAVDWITDKLYFTDASLDIVGVFDPVHFFYRVLVQTGSATQPRAIVLDPNTRMMYWSDWGLVARIEKASMDGSNRRVIHNTGLIWPNALSIDYESQILYWADAYLDKIESSGVDGTNRILLTTTGIGHAYGMVFHQNILYVSDWEGSIIHVLNSTGGGVRSLIQLTTCNIIFGIQVVDLERQPMAPNPCENRNGECSHFCLLSTSTAGYSCACPDGLTLQGSYNCTGVQNPSVSIVPEVILLGSCASAGYNTCCSNNSCEGSLPNCYCDANCHLYGDCCSDVHSSCLTQGYSPYVVVSERYYMRHFDISNPARSRTFLSNLNNSTAIDYHYRMNAIFWENNDFPGIWRSNLNGSGAIPVLNDSTVAKIAIDWVSDKLYWTDYTLKTINVIDLHTGHRKTLFTFPAFIPEEILVDPKSRYIFWTDYDTSVGSGRIVRASMDGSDADVLVFSTHVILITINYSEQTIFWFSGNKFGSIKTDGSNFMIINGGAPDFSDYSFFLSHLENDVLYYTKSGSYKVYLIYENGTFDQLNSTFLGCYGFAGSKVVSKDRQRIEGANPCTINNGGCSDLCLLSATNSSGYSCACHNGTSLSADRRACPETGSVPPPPRHGTCQAAGNTGCCTSGNCRGSPSTCGCDALCVGFRDCCSDAISLCSNISIPVALEVQVTADHTRVREGDNVTLNCSVNRDNPLNYTFTWTHVNTTNYFSSSSMSQSTATLKLPSISVEDTGIYICSVMSEAGTGMDSITIDLGVAPVVLSQVHHPNGPVVVVNSTVQLVCEVSSGDLPISLSWTSPAGAVLSEDINVNISIIIDFSTSLHYGNYTCTANNSFGVATDVLSIIPAALPVVMLHTGQVLTLQVVAGSNLTLSVLISDFNLPLINVSWVHEGNIIISGEDRSTITNPSLSSAPVMSTLQRTAVIPLDSGNYVITATNPAGSQELRFTVTVTAPAVLTDPSSDVLLERDEGEMVTLSCTASGVPQPSIIWSPANSSITEAQVTDSDGFFIVTYYLTIASITRADTVYTCTANNTGSSQTRSFTFTVNFAPSIIASPVHIVQLLSPAALSLTCSADGHPLPNISWIITLSNGSQIVFSMTNTTENRRNLTISTSSNKTVQSMIMIEHTLAMDTGNYSCVAANRLGADISTVSSVSIYEVPDVSFPVDFQQFFTNEKTNITFTCMASGSPAPYISFSYEGEILNSTEGGPSSRGPLMDRVQLGSVEMSLMTSTVLYIVTRALTLFEAVDTDTGNFSCSASAKIGDNGTMSDTVTFGLTVFVAANIIEFPVNQTVTSPDSATFSCIASGFPRPNITWTSPDGATLVSGINNTTITEDNSRGERLLVSTLNIKVTAPSSSGEYSCHVDNGVFGSGDTFTLATAYLTVYVNPNITAFLPGGDVRYVVNATDGVTFQCTATGVPPPLIQWFRGDTYLNSSSDQRITLSVPIISSPLRALGMAMRTLTINRTTIEDAATNYSCRASNVASRGTASEMFELFVQVVPEVQVTADHTRVRKGDNVTLTCSVSRGYPVNYTYTWRHVNMTNSLSSTSMTQSSATLKLLSFSAGDTGIYMCSVMSEAGTGMDNTTINLGVIPVVLSRVSPSNGTVLVVNSTVRLICEVSSGDLPISLSWTDPHGAVLSEDISDNISIIINLSTSLDYGNYTCTANNSFGVATDVLTIIPAAPPVVMLDNGQVLTPQVVAGSNLTLSVLISDFNLPLNNVSWAHEGNIIISGEERSTITIPSLSPAPVMSTLQRTAVIPLDSGNYVITATNPAGSQELRFTVTVTAPAVLTDPSSDVLLERDEGEMVTLSCTASGVPQPSIIWSPANSSITEAQVTDSDGLFIVTYYLTIASVTRADTVYTCTANNTGSSQTRSFTFTVNFAPSIIASPVHIVQLLSPAALSLTCSSDGHPLPNISWIITLSNGSQIVFSMTNTTENRRNLTISTSSNKTVQSMIMIEHTLAMDTGNYSCVAANRLGANISTISSVSIYEVPDVSFPVDFQQFFTNEKTNITFTCMASGSPAPYISFSYEGEILNSTEGGPSSRGPLMDRVHLGSAVMSLMTSTGLYIVTRTLTLFEAVDADTGNFSCSASAKIGDNGTMSDTVTFGVTVFVAANIIEFPVNQTVTSPDSATFSCIASGFPRPNITWTSPDGATLVSGINNTTITEDNSRGERLLVSTLNIKITAPSSSGEYSCHVDNGVFGSGDTFTLATAYLTVYVNPNITAFLPGGDVRYVVNATDGVIFQCTATGVPPPLIQWFREDTYLNSSSDQRITLSVPIISAPLRALGMAMRTLIINGTTIDDTDTNYSCRASNIASEGTTSEMFELFVQVVPEVQVTADHTRVRKGDNVTLTCSVSRGYPVNYTYTWRHVNMTNSLSSTSMTATLKLLSFSAGDTGIYMCSVMSEAGTGMDYITINLGVIPVVLSRVEPPNGTVLVVGSTVQLVCEVSSGDLPISLSWTDPAGTVLSEDANHNISIIINLSTSLNYGNYTCTANNSFGVATDVLNVVQAAPPVVMPDKSQVLNTQVLAGGNLTLSVLISDFNLPLNNVSWTHEGNIIVSGKDRSTIINTSLSPPVMSTLQRTAVIPLDSGSYTITATNPAGSQELTFTVILTAPAVLTDPSYNVSLESDEGEMVTLSCTASGVPQSSIIWSPANSGITEAVHRNSDGFFIATSNLTIASITRTDAVYTCTANNTGPPQTRSFTFTVNFPPSITSSPLSTVQLLSPAALYLTCSADGLPLPIISWIRMLSDGSEKVFSMTGTAESGRNITISTNSTNSVESTIMIGSTHALDTANYSCVAINRLGASNSTVSSVTIFEAPDISFPMNTQQFFTNEKTNITFTCMASGSPAPYISFSYEGQNLNHTEGRTNGKGPLVDRIQIGNATMSLMTSTGLYIVTRTLTLFNAMDADTGNFICSASANITNKGTITDTVTFDLAILVAANITELPVDQSVTSPDTATFSCTASGLPRPNITWINPDGATMVSGVNDTAITEDDVKGERVLVSILNLMMTSLSGSGEYSCNADNGVFGHGDSLTSASINLTVYANPNITEFLPGGDVRYVVNATDGVTFQCTATGVPPPLIQWFRGDTYLNSSADLRITLSVPIISTPVRALGMAMRTLTIIGTTIDDTATNYSCRASNIASEGTTSEMFELFVQVPPVVVPLSQNQRVTANKGHSAILKFQINNAVPAVQTSGLRWYYTSNAPSGTLKFSSNDFKEITNLMNRTSTSILTFSNESLTLTISNIVQAIGDVMETDQGRYLLVATNAAGESSNYTDLVVIGPPQIVGGSQDVFVINDGSSAAVFYCEAIAFPDHKVSWSYTNSTGFTFDPIITTDDTDTEKYLIDRDLSETGFGRLTLNNVTYEDRGTYTCTAINSVGKVSSSGHLTVHVIPILLNISHPTATLLSQSVAIFCQASGFPIPTITWQKNGTDITTTNTSKLDVFSFSPLLIPISNGTNDFEGNGFKGSISELIRMNGLDVNTFISSDELRVVGVLYFKSVAQEDTDTYTCTATNGFPLTTTIMSVSHMVHLIVLEHPDTPINVTATSAGPLSISLTWTSVFVGKSSVTRFIIYIRNVKTSSDFVQVASLSVSDVTIIMGGSYMITVSERNLVLPFTWYSLRVTSCNVIECSNQSQESEPIQTNQDLSTPPRDVSVTATSTSTLTVVGIPPLISNGIITQYIVDYTASKDYDISFSESNSVSFNMAEASGTNGEIWQVVLVDLTPGTTYNIRVSAVNGAVRNNGVGMPSSPATGITGSLPPPPPPQPSTVLADPISPDLRTYTLQLTNFSEINGRISHFHIVVVILPQGQSIGDLQHPPDERYGSIKDLDVYSKGFCKGQPTTPKAYITSEFGRDLLPMDGFVIGMDTSGNNSPNDRQSIYRNGPLCYGFIYTFFIRAYPVVNSKFVPRRSIRQTSTRQYTMFTSTNYYTSTTIVFADILFQLRIQISLACSSWINDGLTDKAEDVVDGVLRELTRRCQCDLATDTTITDAGFQCFPESPQHITFRARIHGTMKVSASKLISYLELWLVSGATIPVKSQRLSVEAMCPVAISSTSEAECKFDDGVTPSSLTSVNTSLTVGIIGVILFGLSVVGIVVVVILLRRRSARTALQNNSTDIVLQNNLTSITQSSPNIPLNSLINQDHFTNPLHIHEECHEYDYIEVVSKEAGNLRANARDGALSQCEAHAAHKKLGDITICNQEYHDYEYLDDFQSLDVKKGQHKETGIVGRIAATNPYFQYKANDDHKEKMEGIVEENYYTEMDNLEGNGVDTIGFQ